MSEQLKQPEQPKLQPREYLESLNNKCDPKLGHEIRKMLELYLSETPLYPGDNYNPDLAAEATKVGIMEAMEYLGLDMKDPSLKDTPRRYAEMLVGELTRGLCYDMFPRCTATPNQGYDQMVLVKDIQVLSLCEHHLQTIDGYAHIAYLPREKLLGLSKFARVTEFFCRRPQVQERLTNQIYWALHHILGTDDIAVVIKAVHYCMKARGSQQHAASTITDKCGGRFLTNAALRQEMLDHVR